MIMPTAFNQYHQIAYVTSDMDEALTIFRDTYNVPRFVVQETATEMWTPAGVGINRLRLAFAFVGDMQIELIQPLEGNISLYTDALKGARSPLVFHHVAIRIDGPMAAWEQFRQGIDPATRPLVLEGAVGDDVRFVYTDERSRLGHYIEYLWFSEEATAMFDQIPHF